MQQIMIDLGVRQQIKVRIYCDVNNASVAYSLTIRSHWVLVPSYEVKDRFSFGRCPLSLYVPCSSYFCEGWQYMREYVTVPASFCLGYWPCDPSELVLDIRFAKRQARPTWRSRTDPVLPCSNLQLLGMP